MSLRWLFNSVFTHTLVYPTEEKQQSKYRNKNGFQMPLHYPRFAKADYADMEEWKVEMLLREYGLDHHIKGSLDEKRRFAMGAFLWPDQL